MAALWTSIALVLLFLFSIVVTDTIKTAAQVTVVVGGMILVPILFPILGSIFGSIEKS